MVLAIAELTREQVYADLLYLGAGAGALVLVTLGYLVVKR